LDTLFKRKLVHKHEAFQYTGFSKEKATYLQVEASTTKESIFCFGLGKSTSRNSRGLRDYDLLASFPAWGFEHTGRFSLLRYIIIQKRRLLCSANITFIATWAHVAD
jgi:hypothetical protein